MTPIRRFQAVAALMAAAPATLAVRPAAHGGARPAAALPAPLAQDDAVESARERLRQAKLRAFVSNEYRLDALRCAVSLNQLEREGATRRAYTPAGAPLTRFATKGNYHA